MNLELCLFNHWFFFFCLLLVFSTFFYLQEISMASALNRSSRLERYLNFVVRSCLNCSFNNCVSQLVIYHLDTHILSLVNLSFFLILSIQKQLSEVFLQKGVPKICSKFSWKHPCRILKNPSWNHTSAWLFSCKFAAYFQNTFSWEYLSWAASLLIIQLIREMVNIGQYHN